jgi:phage terminase large subunit-like protein
VTNKGFPNWLYDETPIDDPLGYGDRAVRFLKTMRHPKSRSRGKAFELPRWQERIVRRIYGPCHPDGRRIVRNVVILLPRGNRKTSLGAALGLLHTIGPERVNGGQVILSAADQKQARIAFEEAAGITRQDQRIEKALTYRDYQNRIVHPKSGAIMEAISCDAGTQHGRTPTFVLADELHAWKKRDLWDVLRTGLVKVPGSLLVVISTAGRGQENVAWDIVDYARRVARGEIDDPATLPVILETPRDADWKDEEVWRRVNPGLADGFPDIEGLRQLAREAESRPADREAFKQLHLNMWLDHSADPFVDMSIYDLGNAPVDLEALEGEPCWLAVDLSSNADLTCIVAAWRDGEGGYIVHPWFFCPKDNLQRRADNDGVPYPLWAEQGLIEPTPGNVVDFRRVEDRIRELRRPRNCFRSAHGAQRHEQPSRRWLSSRGNAARMGDDGSGDSRARARHHCRQVSARRPSYS